MLQQLWTNTLQIGQEALPTAFGMAAMSYGMARMHLETVEAVLLAAVLLLILVVI